MKSTRLEDVRNELNLTKSEMAKKLNVSTSIYCRWENDKDSIPTRRLYEIANILEINIDYIIKISNQKIKLRSNDEINILKVSQNVRTLRKELGLTLRSLGKKLNTTSSTWSAYETGKTLILSSFLIEICHEYKYSADWILGRTTKKYCK